MWLEIFNPRNYYWNPWAVPVFLSGIVFIVLGLFIGIRKKRMLNISFLIWALLGSFWLFGNSLAYMAKYDWVVIEMYNKFEFLGVCFISIAGYLVSMSWNEHLFRKQKKYVIILSIISSIIYLTNLKFNYILSGVYHYFWGRYFKNGFGGTVFIIYWIIPFILTLINYLILHKNAIGVKKRQYKLTLIATFIAYFGATDWLPCYGLEIYPFGYIAILIFFLLIAYAIIRYRAFEIDTVIHKTLLWTLTSASVLIPIGELLYFIRPWLASLGLLQLTLAITALFYVFLYYFKITQPNIDHLFRRRKYDYYAVLAQIPQKIGSELNLKHVTNNLLKQLKETLYIRDGLILVQEPGNHSYIQAGSLGYEELLEEAQSKPAPNLSFESKLCNWLSQQQKALEREQVEVDPQYASIRQEALDFFRINQLEVLIPILMEERINALLAIGKKENLQAFTLRDIELLEKLGAQIGITIDNALHHEDIVEKERLAEELRLGREIQMNLLPKELPQIPTLTVDGLMLPAKEIGGDYYDFITLPKQDELAIVIGDVSGKGVAAGLLMAMAKTAIHTLSQENTSPKEVLLRTNSILYSHIGGQKFMTMLYFRYNPQNKSLTYSSAGHEHILVYRKSSDSIESIMSGGFMLGMLKDIDSYLEEHSIALEPKDKVLLYTDGVTDAESPHGDRFGLERLIQSFKTHSQKTPQELIQAIKDEVYTFMGTQPQYDDITLVGMEGRSI